ncbi:hypothetical protein ACWKWP_09255 [Agromyces soli]
MSGDYRVSGGGSTAVETGELIDEASRLAVAEQHCSLLGERISGVLAILDRTDTGFGRAEPELVLARYQLGEVARIAGELGGRLAEAAVRYGAAEQRAEALRDVTAQLAAWSAGLAARLSLPAAVLLAPAAIEAAWSAGAALDLLGHEAGGLDIETIRRLITWPGAGEAAGLLGDTADEAVAGLLGLPLGISLAAGRSMRAPDNAAVLMALARPVSLLTGVPVFTERPVTVRQVGGPADRAAATGSSVRAPIEPPTSLAEFVERIPEGTDGDAQLLVERYDGAPGERPRWVVYVCGTISFSPVADGQAVDLSSDVASIAARSELARVFDLPPGATEQAVRQALVAAGAEPGDEIVGFGYSAGGEAIANLDLDPSVNLVAGVNFGGPGEAEAPNMLNVRHEEDLVPGTGGALRADAPLTFERRLDPPLDAPGDFPAPAHAIEAYGRTAEVIDGIEYGRVAEFRDRLIEFVEGRTVTETRWTAERVPVEERPAAGGYEPPLPSDPRMTPNAAAG